MFTTLMGAATACSYHYNESCDVDRDDHGRDGDDAGPEGGACGADDDCADGERCVAEVCVPAEPPLACERDEDCAEGERCGDELRCVVDDGATDGCRSNSECAEAEVCVDARCVPEEGTCQFDHQCGPSRGCVDNACRDLCADDAECAAGHACEAGRCLPDEDVCETAADCVDGARCLGGRCFAACESDAACDEGARCEDDGVCRADTAPRAFCESDAECAPGHLCLDGACRTPCPTGEDVECRRSDNQLVRCGESTAGPLLCYSFSEWNPQCARADDCGGEGERCVDGLCL